MCTSIGVDPLVGLNAGASAKRGKSFGWGLLGVGEFWVRVGTRVVGVCRRTRGGNGGFISVEEVRRILSEEDRKARRPGQEVVEISEYRSPQKNTPSNRTEANSGSAMTSFGVLVL